MTSKVKRRRAPGPPEDEMGAASRLDAPPRAKSGTPDGAAQVEVEASGVGARLDKILVEALGDSLSRTRLKLLIEDGFLTVDGVEARDPAARARLGQALRLVIPPAVAAAPLAEAIPLDVIYEDADLIVIDKPAGLVAHPSAGHESGTLVNALLAHCGESLSGIGGVKRPGIVHRLDKDTSGLLVAAKSDAAHRGLAALFADHGRRLGLVRDYVALAWGVPERAAGVVDAALGRHPLAREKQAVKRAGGRQAVTHWRLERAFKDAAGRPLAALLRCRLETGRTHQIRVHLAAIGHPILGDPLYAAGFKTKAERLEPLARAALGALGRQALHAARLGFPHPVTGEDLLFETPPPPDMARLIAALLRESEEAGEGRR